MKHTPACPSCALLGERIAAFDAYACKRCDRWLEGRCDDQACEFCRDRPEKPSMMRS